MAESGITVDTKAFSKQVDRLAKTVGLTGKQVMHDQFRLWITDLMRRFPPTGQKSDNATGKGSIAASKQGRDRVAKDIGKIIVGVDLSELRSQMDIGGQQFFAFKRHSGAVYGVDRDLYDPSASMGKLRAHHDRYRRRDGRVTEARGGSEHGRNSLDIGRWKFVDKLHVRKSTQRRFIREKQESVGKLKAGWMPAAVAFNAIPPAFVRNQMTRLGSTSGTRTMKDNGDGYFEARNNVPYAGRFERIVKFTGHVRQLDLDRQLEKGITRKINLENQREA